MKLDNENYEIWKILMEVILVRKQLREVALGLTLRPAGPPNAVRAWDRKNQEARAEMQLAVEWDHQNSTHSFHGAIGADPSHLCIVPLYLPRT